jgi:uncharacterized phage protein (TIGR02220 family)
MPRKKVRIFPLYEELRRVTAALTNDQFGKAVRHALSRYYDGEEQEETDGVISLAAAMMLDQAARYDSFREQQRENGLKPKNGGQPREAKVSQGKPNTADNTDVEPGIPPIPIPVPIPNNTCAKAVQLLNDLSGSSFRASTKSTQKLIAAREKDGYTLEDIEMVIRHQCGLWGKDANMSKYLRPETLFGNKFEGYLSDARRNNPSSEQGYTLASLEDPWEVAMRGADGHV